MRPSPCRAPVSGFSHGYEKTAWEGGSCGQSACAGAGSGIRTHTLFTATDFESVASTSSAIPARAGIITGRRRLPLPVWSGGAIQGQAGVGAAVPFAVCRQVPGAVLHRTLVDVQGDGDAVRAGVADGVVFVRRDQAAGAAGAGLDAAGGAEAAAVAVAFEQ